MFDKLSFLEEKYKELAQQIADPNVIADQQRWQKLSKELADIKPITEKYAEYKKVKTGIEESKELINEPGQDEELKELAKMELAELEAQIDPLESELKVLLIPKDPNDEKNVILEVRAGTGGEEAGLFAADLIRMYTRYAERQGWKTEVLSMNNTGIGGVKEGVILIKGRGAYSRLKYESGVHRVQRVPETEASGRIHTSAATVAVLPEVDDVEVHLDMNDVRVDTYRASGHGGQHVNTTDSAIRLTHIPTDLVVTCQDEKSQTKNKEKAFKVLRARLFDLHLQQQHDEISEQRKTQVGSGDRSERIRTYNFPQGRVSDHRINLTLYKLDAFMDGDLDEIIDALITHDQAEKMKTF